MNGFQIENLKIAFYIKSDSVSRSDNELFSCRSSQKLMYALYQFFTFFCFEVPSYSHFGVLKRNILRMSHTKRMSHALVQYGAMFD